MQNWVCTNCAPASILACSPFGCQPGGGSIGLSAPPRKKLGAAGDLAAGRQFAAVAQAPRGLEQRARVEIEHRLGVGLIAGARVVAAQHQQIAHAAGSRAQQIALQGDAVAVAAGELQHRLDAVLDQQRGRRHRAEMRARAGAVGDVDRVGEALERGRLGEKSAALGADRRRDFRGDHKAPGRQLLLQRHLQRHCHRSTSQNPVDLASTRMRQ